MRQVPAQQWSPTLPAQHLVSCVRRLCKRPAAPIPSGARADTYSDTPVWQQEPLHRSQQQQQQQQQQSHQPLQQLLQPTSPNYAQQPQQTQTTVPGNSRAASLARALQLHPRQAAAMMIDYPPLSDFNHARLADKLHELASLLLLQPQQLSAALVQQPQVLGASLRALEQRVTVLHRVFGGVEVVQQVVLQEPSLLCWSPQQLKQRTQNMASCLGLHQQQLLHLLQQHPQLLPASHHLAASLRLLQQLLQRAADGLATQQSFGFSQPATAAAAVKLNVGQHTDCIDNQQQQKQQQQQRQPGVSAAAVRAFALSNPQLLLQQPDDIVARLATLQAQSGLSLNEVAAVMAGNPRLLLADLGTVGTESAGSSKRMHSSSSSSRNGSDAMPAAGAADNDSFAAGSRSLSGRHQWG